MELPFQRGFLFYLNSSMLTSSASAILHIFVHDISFILPAFRLEKLDGWTPDSLAKRYIDQPFIFNCCSILSHIETPYVVFLKHSKSFLIQYVDNQIYLGYNISWLRPLTVLVIIPIERRKTICLLK